MKFIFCADPLELQRADRAFQSEVAAAIDQRAEIGLVDYETLVAGETANSIRGVPRGDSLRPAVYRGWMLKSSHYGRLYDALLAKEVRLINDPAEYRTCHHMVLPDSMSASPPAATNRSKLSRACLVQYSLCPTNVRTFPLLIVL